LAVTTNAVDPTLSHCVKFAYFTNWAFTFYNQPRVGGGGGVYILELGPVTSPHVGIAALNKWMTDNAGVFYGFTVPANWDTIPAPDAPVLSSTSGGTLAATTYYVKVAYVSASGTVGLTSAEVSLAVDADYLLSVASPPALSGATDYNVYVSDSTGTETLQNTSPIAIGTDFTEPSSGLVSGDVAPLTLATLANTYSAPTAKTYLFITTSSINQASYGVMTGTVWAGYKAACTIAPSPTAQSGEFPAAGVMYQELSNSPGPASKLPPTQFRYLYGFTPWPYTGYSTELSTFATYGTNWIGTGAEGGIGEDILMGGTLASLDQISWWYGVDWFQIQAKQAQAAAIINGSNSQPPLLYDQNGINDLEAVAENVGHDAVTYGCAASVSISATPYSTYVKANPTLAGAGYYGGFLADVVGQNGFLKIQFYIDAIKI
jgi:hypothetical protein